MTFFRRRLLFECMQLFDLTVIAASFGLATLMVYRQTNGVSLHDFLGMRAKIGNVCFFLVFLLCSHTCLSAFGLYQSRRLSNGRGEIEDVLRVTLTLGVTLWLSERVFHFVLLNSLFLAIFVVVSSLLMVSSRLILRRVLARMRIHGRNLRHMLIVGTNARAVRFAKQVEASPELGYRLVGFVDDDWSGTGEFHRNGYALVSDLAGFPDYVRHNVLDEVVIELPLKSRYQQALEVFNCCQEQGIIVRCMPDIFNSKLGGLEDPPDEIPVLACPTASRDGWPLLVKRLLDISASSLALVLLSPLFLAVAIMIKLTSHGPIFFVQERLGLNKRRFRLYKFRTMVPEAEKMMAELEALNEMSGPVFKITNDPRITCPGRFLRKSSIDELPQLFNVLTGDMSLVGPRPLPLRDYGGFEQDWQRRRFSVRPGLTCLWQINGRNRVEFEYWMHLDMQYIDNWSLWLDWKILALTIPAIIRGEGAA
jgi:exopolysaccharide biosynthesis polyprenyl glycosylphosphotransferase